MQFSELDMHSGNGSCSAIVVNVPKKINNGTVSFVLQFYSIVYWYFIPLFIYLCLLILFFISVAVSDACTSSEPRITVPKNRGEYLEEARLKYFFKDTGLPSFRLVEDEDDNGKTILEPELFRPIGMDDYTYNKQVEVLLFSFNLLFSFLF